MLNYLQNVTLRKANIPSLVLNTISLIEYSDKIIHKEYIMDKQVMKLIGRIRDRYENLVNKNNAVVLDNELDSKALIFDLSLVLKLIKDKVIIPDKKWTKLELELWYNIYTLLKIVLKNIKLKDPTELIKIIKESNVSKYGDSFGFSYRAQMFSWTTEYASLSNPTDRLKIKEVYRLADDITASLNDITNGGDMSDVLPGILIATWGLTNSMLVLLYFIQLYL